MYCSNPRGADRAIFALTTPTVREGEVP